MFAHAFLYHSNAVLYSSIEVMRLQVRHLLERLDLESLNADLNLNLNFGSVDELRYLLYIAYESNRPLNSLVNWHQSLKRFVLSMCPSAVQVHLHILVASPVLVALF